jgi:hypothetical protein
MQDRGTELGIRRLDDHRSNADDVQTPRRPQVIIAPDGGDAWAPAKPRPDETLIRALARAHRWKRMLEEGICRSAEEVAESQKVTRSFVNRLLRLTLLAPDIQEAILDGLQPKGMALEELTCAMPSGWEQQHQRLACP